MKEVYRNNMINYGYTNDSLLTVVFEIESEANQLNKFIKRFKTVDDLKKYLWHARHDKWLMEQNNYLPSMLNSDKIFSRIINKVELSKQEN